MTKLGLVLVATALGLSSLIVALPSATGASPQWSTAVNISANAGDSEAPAVAVGSDIHVVWQDDTGGSDDIFYSNSTDGGGNWSTAVNISATAGDSWNPAIAAGSDIHVVWQDHGTGGPPEDILYSKSTDGGGNWSTAVNISANAGNSWSPAIAAGSDIHVVWMDNTGKDWNKFDILYCKSSDGGANWSTAVNMSANAGDSSMPAIAAGSDIHVVWQDNTGGDYDILYSKSSDGETWSTPVNISANAGDSRDPAIATGSDIHVVWEDDTGGNWDILYSKSSAPPQPPVGGEAYLVNKLGVLMPWIALAVLLAVSITLLTLRRRRARS